MSRIVNKIALVVGIICLTSSAAWAFGGGGHGRISTMYKGGVSAIGVHFGGQNQKEIKIVCPEHSAWSDEDLQCLCDTDWTMNGNVCVPATEAGCAQEGMYWCSFAQVCVANEQECFGLCAEGRLCPLDAQTYVCCAENEYCRLDSNTCDGPIYGTCSEITLGTPTNLVGLGDVVMGEDLNLSWGAADNWCKAQGMRLITVEELECYSSSNPNERISTGMGLSSYCCAKGRSCSYDGYWSDHSMAGRFLRDLAEEFGSRWFWTSSAYSEDGSCSVYIGDTTPPFYIESLDRYDYDGDVYALCVAK